MSTSKQPLKLLWRAYFSGAEVLKQPEDDRYSKHDDKAEHNPSAFRDVIEHPRELHHFALFEGDELRHGIDLRNGIFYTGNGHPKYNYMLEDNLAPLKDRKVIFYRDMLQQGDLENGVGEPYVNAYVLGYEGKDADDKVVKHTIRIVA